MVCKNCGTENQPNSKFCAGCGTPLEEAQSTQNTYAQPQEPTYNYAAPNNMQPASVPGKGFAISGMVLGIVSFFCFPAITGILGIIFGALAKKKGYRGGMATAGIVCGIVGVALWLLMLIGGWGSLIGIAELTDSLNL